MKNILVFVLSVLLLISLYFLMYPPQKISFSSGFMGAPQQFTTKCVGIYIQTWDYTPIDGARGGLCFGKIKKTENEKLPCNSPYFTSENSWCY